MNKKLAEAKQIAKEWAEYFWANYQWFSKAMYDEVESALDFAYAVVQMILILTAGREAGDKHARPQASPVLLFVWLWWAKCCMVKEPWKNKKTHSKNLSLKTTLLSVKS